MNLEEKFELRLVLGAIVKNTQELCTIARHFSIISNFHPETRIEKLQNGVYNTKFQSR